MGAWGSSPSKAKAMKNTFEQLSFFCRAAFAVGLLTCSSAFPQAPQSSTLAIEVTFPESLSHQALDGRLLLIVARSNETEPRFQIDRSLQTQQIFGIDIEGLGPGEVARIDDQVFGSPLQSLAEVPTGEYWVQAVLHKYETFHRADGHSLKLPMDRGEGQKWNRAPGNLISTPKLVTLDPTENRVIQIALDTKIPPIPEPADTQYIKHVRIQSDLLTEFWGRPMFLGAHVLLPEGFDDHPDARYPLIVNHGHFPQTFGGFREAPPDPNLEPEYSKRFGIDGYNQIVQEEAHAFYRYWTAPDTPRFLIIKIQHPNPYYDNSYAVNSANLGPYGDAINYELIPHIEKQFRGMGEGWARFLYGGSTGGWIALGVQVFYPDFFNGAWAACPDPVDFRAYTSVNIYEDENAYFDGDWKRTQRPRSRNNLGEIRATLMETEHQELALATRGRSAGQHDIWQAVFSPVGKDGYPRPIWDKRTGVIDPEVAQYWRENYDLRHILERDWDTLGSKLEGKIHVYTGDMDNYYLNNAVYLLEDFLEGTTDPYYGGEIDYGDRAEHCWNGVHDLPNAISRLRYHRIHIPKIMRRIEESAPEGADLTSWRY